MSTRPPSPPTATPPRAARPGSGFTLVELLVTMTLVAVLAAIAYPSYRAQIQKTRRADAQAVLQQSAQFMERLYTENVKYPYPAVLPYTKSPIDGTASYYAITPTVPSTADAFTVTADPAGGPEAGAGILQIDHTGRRGRDLNGDGDTVDAGEDHW